MATLVADRTTDFDRLMAQLINPTPTIRGNLANYSAHVRSAASAAADNLDDATHLSEFLLENFVFRLGFPQATPAIVDALGTIMNAHPTLRAPIIAGVVEKLKIMPSATLQVLTMLGGQGVLHRDVARIVAPILADFCDRKKHASYADTAEEWLANIAKEHSDIVPALTHELPRANVLPLVATYVENNIEKFGATCAALLLCALRSEGGIASVKDLGTAARTTIVPVLIARSSDLLLQTFPRLHFIKANVTHLEAGADKPCVIKHYGFGVRPQAFASA